MGEQRQTGEVDRRSPAAGLRNAVVRHAAPLAGRLERGSPGVVVAPQEIMDFGSSLRPGLMRYS